MPNEKVTLEVDVYELNADNEAQIVEARLEMLVTRYRIHAEQKKTVETAMNPIKAEIFEIIKERGDYKDDIGYARVTNRKAGVSYTPAEIEKLADVWSESNDSIMKMCGNLLNTHRKVKPASSFPTIK